MREIDDCVVACVGRDNIDGLAARPRIHCAVESGDCLRFIAHVSPNAPALLTPDAVISAITRSVLARVRPATMT